MRNKNILLTLTAIVSLLCLYYLSFTFVARGIESDAVSFATSTDGKIDLRKKQAYLDSMWTQPVFLGHTYKQVKNNEVKLGLDLQGGMHVTMEVSAADVVRVLGNNNQSAAFQKALAEATAANRANNQPYIDAFVAAFQKEAAGVKLATIFANKNNRDKITFQSSDEDVKKYLSTELESTIDQSFKILRARIDEFGVTQPNIQQLQGTNRIQVELPGVDNPERVRKLLQSVAKLEFYEVWEGNEFNQYFVQINELLVKEEEAKKSGVSAAPLALDTKSDAAATTDTTAAATADSSKKDTNDLAQQLEGKKAANDTAKKAGADSLNTKQSSVLERLFSAGGKYGVFGALVKDTSKVNQLFARADVQALLPSDMKFLWASKPIGADNEPVLQLFAIKKSRGGKAPLEGDVIVDARQDFGQTGEPEVTMRMNATGANKWKRLTGANVGRRIAIVLDNLVYSAPVVQNEIPGGSSSINGSFTIEEAKDLANTLKAGKMPVPTRIVEEAVVGPTLGQESINKGLLSIFAGFATIILFMLAYYSNSGVAANLAVLLNVFLILGFLVPVHGVLTLPGIAGIVLTIGMAVDANVLINERVKDELRAGLPLSEAVSQGYKAASVSIWDANLTTLIAGFVLLFFGSGPVKGFATTLIIGIGTSLFTSIYITRIITESWLARNPNFSFSTGFSKDLFKGTNFDFVGKRKLAYIGSTIFIGLGIASMAIRGFNYGVDFKGGWTYTVEFADAVGTTEIRDALTAPLQAAPEVKTYGGSNKVQVTTTYLIDDQNEDAAEKVESAVKAGLSKLPNAKYEILSSSKVGPTVANDIKRAAYIAVIISMLGIFAYIWARFKKWEYATGTIVAVIHDTLFIMSVYSLFKDILPFSLEIDQNFIAAILTIVGYSVNDTVVIFDRVREFFRESDIEEDTATVVNKALNDTFSRTVITATTVFLVVLILLVFGGETIRGLSFALLLGVITGTYSTIYLAIPFVVDAKKGRIKE